MTIKYKSQKKTVIINTYDEFKDYIKNEDIIKNIKSYDKVNEKLLELYNNTNNISFSKLRKNIKNIFYQLTTLNINYWIDRGYTENEAKNKISDIQRKIGNQFIIKRKENPELYQDYNTSQIGYWLKQGYSKEESKDKLKNRQTTFSLEKCIKKHGEDEGQSIFDKRQIKWMNSIKDKIDNIKKDSSSMDFYKDKYGSECYFKSLEHYTHTDKMKSIIKNVLDKNQSLDEFLNEIVEFFEFENNKISIQPVCHSKILCDYFEITETILKHKLYEKYGVMKTIFGNHRFFNNHLCRSNVEYEISKFLVENDIPYIYEKNYPNSNFVCDFYLPNIDLYIEYLGFLNNENPNIKKKAVDNYRDKYKIKEQFCIDNNINYYFSESKQQIINKIKKTYEK